MVMLDVSLHPLQGPYLFPPVKQWDSETIRKIETTQVFAADAVTI
jgi:hypothetical protein